SPLLSPVKCARNGWINVDCGTLKCPQCAAKLIAELPDDLTGSEEVRWIERLNQMLQTSHNVNCPWRGHECSEGIYSIPLATSQEMVDEVCRHATELLKVASHLPAAQHPLSSFQSGLLRDLRSKVTASGGDSSEHRSLPSDRHIDAALELALFGWRLDRSLPRPGIKCELCFRSVGLWLFKSIDGEPRTDSVTSATDTDSEALIFNLVDEHRVFCYWAHGSSAGLEQPHNASANTAGQPASVGAIPGWQKTIASILRSKPISSGSSESSLEASSDGGETSSSANNATDDEAGDTSQSIDEGMALFKRLKPFNISAISSAAEAFGIPFSISLLARATKKIAQIKAADRDPLRTHVRGTAAGELAAANALNSSVLLTTDIDEHIDVEHSDDVLPAGAYADWDYEESAGSGIDGDHGQQARHAQGHNAHSDGVDDEIQTSIDTSGLASLLGESSLASALEDPAQAQAILEYVKSLLRAKAQEAPSTAK
ncbi:hypothetical protein EV174_002243, partial [Coemansia sp. RSA 2320]